MSTTPQWSDAFLQRAMSAARVGFWDWDLRTNLVTYSAEWKRQLGYNEDEISNELAEWESRVHPDDLPKLRQRTGEYLGHPWPDYEEEFRIQRKDGSWRWMLARAELVMDEQGRPARMVGCHLDITRQKLIEDALRQSERELRLVIDTIPAMAWIVLPDGTLDFLNRRWLEYTGLSLEEAIEQPTGTIHPEDLPRVMEKWSRDMPAGEPSEDEMRLRRADGEYRWFLIRTVPLREEQGNILKWYGTSTDIEDRK